MSETVTQQSVVAWLRVFAVAVAEHREELTELDAAIGDADHGFNMDRGMQAVVGRLDGPSAAGAGGVGALLKLVGMTLVSTVGGAAGPLYGTFFLQMGKAAGEAAELRRPLAEVAGLCRKVNANARSMGVALTSCTVPLAGRPTFELGADEMEIGVGIHGEPGRERRRLASAHAIVEELASAIVDDLPFSRGERVLAFVNGMGGTPLMELYVVYGELHKLLEARGITIARNLIGSYITALDMAGCSITLLRLDDELTALWDAPVNTTGLRWGV